MELKRGYKQTEVGVIPEEWEVETVRGVSRNIIDFRGRTPKKLGMDWGGGEIPALSARNVKKGFIDFGEECNLGSAELYRRWMTQGDPAKDDIAVTMEAPLGNVAMIPDDHKYILSQRTVLLQLDADKAQNHFVFQLLMSSAFQRSLTDNATGSTAQGIQRRKFETLPMARPPLPEQRAIAGVLGDVDALLGALDRLIVKKRDLKQAAMQQLLTGQTRLPGFASQQGFKETEGGRVPKDWDVKPLLSVLRIANGQVDPKAEPYRSMTLVAPDHIESCTGRLLARETAADQKAISGKYLFSKGDIVYSKIRPYLRKAIVADFDGLCSADMYPLKPVGDNSPDFMLAVLLGHRFSMFAESVSVRSGMPKINRAELAEYAFAVPPPDEQLAIASVLSDMDAELSSLEARRNKTRLLKQGMMQELLTGRIRLV